jgi:hypothetical protein
MIMKHSLYSVYSNVYSTAMMQDVKPVTFAAVANKANENRFSKLVRLLSRA